MFCCRPRLVPWPGRVTGPFPVLYADAFFLDGDLRKKPGHLAADEVVSKAARKAFIYVLEIVAQVLPLVTFARRLSPFWIAFIDNVAGQFALMKGYGKDPSVNGILASFWGLAADRQWSPDFHRVPSASNVSDAISRRDDSRARTEGWTRVATPVDDIMDVLCQAARDIEFACHADLRNALDADRADRRQESDKHLAMLREGTVGLDAQRHALESVEQRHMLDLQNIRSELAQASRKVTAFADEQLELLRLSNEELARKLKTLESDTHRKLAEVQAGNEQAMKNVSAAEAHSHEIDARLSQTAMNHSERLLKASARQDELLEAVEHAKAERNNLDVKLNRSAAQSKEQEDTLAKVDEALRKLVEKESGLIREELQSVHRKMASQQTKIADIELRWLDNHPSMESSLVASGKNADASKAASSPQTSDESPAVFEPTTPGSLKIDARGGLAAVSGHASPPVMGSFILPQAKPWTSFCKLPSNSQAQGVRTIAGNVASGTASPLPGGVYSPRAPVTVHTVPATLSSHRLLATPDRSPNIKYTRLDMFVPVNWDKEVMWRDLSPEVVDSIRANSNMSFVPANEEAMKLLVQSNTKSAHWRNCWMDDDDLDELYEDVVDSLQGALRDSRLNRQLRQRLEACRRVMRECEDSYCKDLWAQEDRGERRRRREEDGSSDDASQCSEGPCKKVRADAGKTLESS
ncbi:hypothetical protein AK812_SmicGene29674 [Symbiodinium microadriaticum]|uniref:Uncharacterized protein n=1 Tax=Symbiodinium microadriaticum TaxID=2951 RepID=A0A1Q9D191_SYMMI|nr:hypothetical protein AK812_SmicGene29674 [Symbiodinium microadriaticum]